MCKVLLSGLLSFLAVIGNASAQNSPVEEQGATGSIVANVDSLPGPIVGTVGTSGGSAYSIVAEPTGLVIWVDDGRGKFQRGDPLPASMSDAPCACGGFCQEYDPDTGACLFWNCSVCPCPCLCCDGIYCCLL